MVIIVVLLIISHDQSQKTQVVCILLYWDYLEDGFDIPSVLKQTQQGLHTRESPSTLKVMLRFNVCLVISTHLKCLFDFFLS